MTAGAALAVLLERGLVQSATLPGMLAVDGERSLVSGQVFEEPVLADPATGGCLMYLLRQALSSLHQRAHPNARSIRIYVIPTVDGSWTVVDPFHSFPIAPTEVEAVVAALVALAEEEP